MTPPTIQTASVKVMRSHDYCHFEVVLGSTEANTPELVDELRKTAARLADKAVEQYKKSKEVIAARDGYSGYISIRDRLQKDFDEAMKVPAGERTPEQKSVIKTYKDAAFHANRSYDYQDDWQDDQDDEI